ncbi:MAG: hypothetical protein F6K10_05930 [Moorea sp. SIO2B7]|nr:hypothetical protein [Moorena sp. SIO2B7]
MKVPLHIYSALFENEDAAFEFSAEIYDDNGDASSKLWTEIGVNWLDHDFLETIYGEDRFAYLKTLLNKPEDVDIIANNCEPNHNTLFLVFGIESNKNYNPSATQNLKFIGTFTASFERT